MNIRSITYYIGNILRIVGVAMLPALFIAIFADEHAEVMAFAITIGAMLLFSLCLTRFKRPENNTLYSREGFVIVSLGWILISLFGALPFLISGAIPNFIDSWFEIVSGFTTTGASILSDVESLAMSLKYWRSFSNWIGGMGVLVFVLAIVPMSKGSGSLHLLRAESPGPSVGKLTPKISHTARILYLIYIGLTVLQMVLLLLGGMPLFDSVLTAFSTAGTGGFSITNTSLAAYDSYYLQGVVAVFMMIFSINFNIYYLILLGHFSHALRSEELRVYLGMMLCSTVIIALNIMPMFGNAFDAFHHSYFQVSSIMSSTGFSTRDYTQWPALSQMLLLTLSIFGASAGSTGGGMKTARVIILFKSLKYELSSLLRPRTVKVMCMDQKPIDSQTVKGTYAFLIAYLGIFLLSTLLLSLDNLDAGTNISATISALSNIGPGLSLVGPAGNFSVFSPFSKLVLSADMLLGRLEIFPLLLLFSPSVWRKKV